MFYFKSCTSLIFTLFVALFGGALSQLSAADLFDLPLGSQPAVSRVLGRDDPAYRAVPIDGGYAMTNPAHRFSAKFDASGVTIKTGAHQWGIALVSVADAVMPKANGNRVEYDHGTLTEWYVNGPLGLEQGFTIATPSGNRHDGPLTLSLSLSGGLVPEVDDSKTSLTLRQPPGKAVLGYRGLTAYDASGRRLRAWMDVSRSVLSLRIDDEGAQYPIVIDPFIQQAKLTASDRAAADVFGHSVAISGNTIVVGAPYDNSYRGSAYVFVKSSTGWTTGTETAKLTSSDGVSPDQVGYSVAISGDTIVVGAVGDDSFRGAAYIFVKPSTGWVTSTETAKLTASDRGSGDFFGDNVKISNDTVVIGSQYADSNKGSAYVFVKPQTGWVSGNETAKLRASDGVQSDFLGIHVGISGDTIVVGASRKDIGRGAAYVFVKPSGGWVSTSETAKLTASDGESIDNFGFSVAVSGDTVAVGAWKDDTARGSAYVFVKPGTGWVTTTETAKLIASDRAPRDQFGISIAIGGDTVVVGAWNDDSERGSSYVFQKPSGGWATATESAKLIASDGVAGDHLGTSVDINNGTIVIGGYGDDFGKGSAYVFGSNP